tara:strand:- start:1396 stop:1884 length:489 start_codon:yes stop_codon:yes gene_type:complete
MEFETTNMTEDTMIGRHNDGKDWSLEAESLFKGKGNPLTASLRWAIPEGTVPYTDYWDVSLVSTDTRGVAVARIQAWLHDGDDPTTGMMVLNSITRTRQEPIGKVYYLVQPEARQFEYLSLIFKGTRANIRVQAMGALRTFEQSGDASLEKFLEDIPSGQVH